MSTNPTFMNTRQQASAAMLAIGMTLSMLFSINLLATQPATDAQMAAAAASNAQVVSRVARSPQG